MEMSWKVIINKHERTAGHIYLFCKNKQRNEARRAFEVMFTKVIDNNTTAPPSFYCTFSAKQSSNIIQQETYFSSITLH